MTIVDTKETGWHLLASEAGTKVISSSIQLDILITTLKQSIAKNWLSTISTRYEEPLPVISVHNKEAFDSVNQCVDGWLSLVREKLYSNSSVEGIFVTIEDNNVDVWVIVPERDLTALDQLADIEWELLEMFASEEHPAFLIDFHVIYLCGRNIEDLAPTRAIRLSRQV